MHIAKVVCFINNQFVSFLNAASSKDGFVISFSLSGKS